MGTISLEGNLDEMESFTLCDLQGKDMHDHVIILDRNTHQITLDLSRLERGLYILETPNHVFKVRKE
jgi:hypothetical protein